MTGGLLISSGRISVKDTDGSTRFDTDDGLFHVIDSVSGSKPIAQFNGGNENTTNQTDSFALGTCHADCTDVVGAIKFTLNNYAAGMAFDRWHTMMGGSALWVMDGQTGASSDNSGTTVLVTYSLRVASGVVYLDRYIFISSDVSVSYSILSHTITYKLKAGLFT